MPNHVTNNLTFHGDPDAIQRMLEAVKSDEEGFGSIDFNKLIPMPKELNIESGSRTTEGIKLYNAFLEIYKLGHEGKVDLFSIPEQSEKAFLDMRKDIDKKTWALGRAACRNIQLFGHPTWYSWCTCNWGTKWNAYDFSSDGNNLSFHVRFSYVSQEQRSEINDFRQTLQGEYDAYIKKQAERAQAEYEHTQSLPFPSVGQYVTQSQLAGMTREGKDNKTFDVSTTKYVCVVGTKKYRLWITDYNCIKKVVELSSGRTSSSSSGKSGSSSIGTGPSVDGFSDPADFYEWFWDDFVDFEDAEEYYYSHGGK